MDKQPDINDPFFQHQMVSSGPQEHSEETEALVARLRQEGFDVMFMNAPVILLDDDKVFLARVLTKDGELGEVLNEFLAMCREHAGCIFIRSCFEATPLAGATFWGIRYAFEDEPHGVLMTEYEGSTA